MSVGKRTVQRGVARSLPRRSLQRCPFIPNDTPTPTESRGGRSRSGRARAFTAVRGAVNSRDDRGSTRKNQHFPSQCCQAGQCAGDRSLGRRSVVTAICPRADHGGSWGEDRDAARMRSPRDEKKIGMKNVADGKKDAPRFDDEKLNNARTHASEENGGPADSMAARIYCIRIRESSPSAACAEADGASCRNAILMRRRRRRETQEGWVAVRVPWLRCGMEEKARER